MCLSQVPFGLFIKEKKMILLSQKVKMSTPRPIQYQSLICSLQFLIKHVLKINVTTTKKSKSQNFNHKTLLDIYKYKTIQPLGSSFIHSHHHIDFCAKQEDSGSQRRAVTSFFALVLLTYVDFSEILQARNFRTQNFMGLKFQELTRFQKVDQC